MKLIHLIIPVIYVFQNQDFLVKIKVKVLYPSLFAIIVNNQAILRISEWIALKRKREKERQESPKPTGLTSLRL